MPLIRSFAQQNRGPGRLEFPANGFDVGDNANATLEVRTLLDQATLDDPATAFEVGLEVLRDGLWRFSAGFTFVGGPNQGKNGAATTAPGFKAGMAEYRNQTIRLFAVLPTALNIGAEVWRTK